jgi:hypothetical protein
MGNLLDNDPLVSKIMEAISNVDGEAEEKLKALIRAGKIAEVYSPGDSSNWEAFKKTFENCQPPEIQPTSHRGNQGHELP